MYKLDYKEWKEYYSQFTTVMNSNIANLNYLSLAVTLKTTIVICHTSLEKIDYQSKLVRLNSFIKHVCETSSILDCQLIKELLLKTNN